MLITFDPDEPHGWPEEPPPPKHNLWAAAAVLSLIMLCGFVLVYLAVKDYPDNWNTQAMMESR